MSDALNKLNRISRYGGLIAKVIMAILVIAIVALVILLAVTVADPELSFNPADWNNMIIAAPVTIGQIQAAALAAIATIAAILAIMYYIDRLFTSLHKNNTPFTDENVRNLRIIAILILAATIVLAIIGAALSYVFDTDAMTVIGFNPFTLLVALMVYILSLIFSYGVTLQRESDQTL
ncbi:MAG: DUF2975 domain-containing protein [Methanomassiliicoccaceae archaeon]|nr:DUF2975 domain-containing protein [Methanomassiliicoccaceae archaeon]